VRGDINICEFWLKVGDGTVEALKESVPLSMERPPGFLDLRPDQLRRML